MKSNFHFQGDSFLISHYNEASPFSSFFPALAGETGKPMWVFYTNRGQAISSFGINNKDGAMLEFLPANKAYQATPLLGFRTLFRFKSKNGETYEPFYSSGKHTHQEMLVRPHELELREKNTELGIETRILYYGVPSESFPVLARQLSVKNLNNKPLSLDVIDGLPRVVPWGMNDYLVKHMSRTIEAFAEVENLAQNVPFFKLKIEPHDRPELRWLHEGFFSFGIQGTSHVPVVVDPSFVFGQDTAFLKPADSFGRPPSPSSTPLTSNIMPCSFFTFKMNIPSHATSTFQSYYGHSESLALASHYAEKVRTNKPYFDEKRNDMKTTYENLVKNFNFRSDNEPLNMYANATFMDNVLRGGLPTTLGPKGPVIHVYSRKHGDMERDYNSFQVMATPYSQGNGNFRDVNQNRRHDLLVNPNVGTLNVDMFFNLLQLDGYNPLVINPVKFIVPKDALSKLDVALSEDCRMEFQLLTRDPVLVGRLYEFSKKHARDSLGVNLLFHNLVAGCTPQQGVEFEEGCWIDHWIYNLDHLDQYLAVYPDKKQWLLFEKEDYTFFDSDHFVRPRREKYIITHDGFLRQFNAVTLSQQKRDLIHSRLSDPKKVRNDNGHGEILKTNLFIKLLSLAVVKLSSLDPFGMGIEMEANKPGWCDALNGLPGLFGSSTHEMFELQRLIRFILDEALPLSPNKAIDMPMEISHFAKMVEGALPDAPVKDFREVWDGLSTARENFREHSFLGVTGKMRPLRVQEIRHLLEKGYRILEAAAKKSIDPETGLPTSYYTYDVDASSLDDGWRQHLSKFEWKQHRLAPFLEGAVHAMKLSHRAAAKKLYQGVRKSPLFDKKLGMYKLNAPLKDESTEIGRIHVFSPGWLENESIFLHMHYKYLLEILRSGLTEEFLDETTKGLIPFCDPNTYGRPTFENSSFIASSRFPVADYHGKGFVARLSGATCEFLSMVYFMALGRHPFKAVEGGVVFTPVPTIPKEWFTKEESDAAPKNSFGFRLFGVPVVYLNPSRRDTFGTGAVVPSGFEWIADGRFHNHTGHHLPLEASNGLREGRLESLTIFLEK
jgi:hypothetical protein